MLKPSLVRCPSCGAPILTSSDIKIYTCKFCGSVHEFVNDLDAVSNESTAKNIHSSAQKVASELAIVRLKKDIKKLGFTLASSQADLIATERKLKNIILSMEKKEARPDFFRNYVHVRFKKNLFVKYICFILIFLIIFPLPIFILYKMILIIFSIIVVFGFIFKDLPRYVKDVKNFPMLEIKRLENQKLAKRLTEEELVKVREEINSLLTDIKESEKKLGKHIEFVKLNN